MCINTHISKMSQVTVLKSAYNINSSHSVVHKYSHYKKMSQDTIVKSTYNINSFLSELHIIVI